MPLPELVALLGPKKNVVECNLHVDLHCKRKIRKKIGKNNLRNFLLQERGMEGMKQSVILRTREIKSGELSGTRETIVM
jgi:hypothetical protein